MLPKFNHRGTGELLVKTKLEKVDNEDRVLGDVKGRKDFLKKTNQTKKEYLACFSSVKYLLSI